MFLVTTHYPEIKQYADRQAEIQNARMTFDKETLPRIQKEKHATKQQKEAETFQRGDSVMIYPEKKIGIVCIPSDEKGNIVVQTPSGKITLNHKRIKLHVAAQQLYPEDYDFSILFDSVETRKKRHQMSRKYVKDLEIHLEEK